MTEDDQPGDEVRTVLAEIEASEEMATLESRVAEVEQELERASARAEDAERARRGELQVMRARIEDALELVRTTTDEQRDAWTQLERRLAEVVHEADSATGRLVEGLREDLTPKVARADLRTEELAADLRGELEAASEDVGRQLDAIRRELDAAAGELRAAQNLRSQQSTELVSSMDDRLSELAEALERERALRDEAVHSVRTRLDDLTNRVEDVDQRAVSQSSRHLAELGHLHRSVEETGGRVEVLAQRVSSAVEDVAGELATRVASLAAELAAVRDASVRQQERLASMAARPAQASAETVLADGAAYDRRLARIEQRLEELAGRVEEAERVANAAGRAIASAVRRARPDRATGAGSPSPSP